MTWLIWLLVYIVGCVLSYYRVVACLADEAKADNVIRFLRYAKCTPLGVVLSSWVGFLSGIVTYCALGDDDFFRWSPKDHK
jgi:hypothetical protein